MNTFELRPPHDPVLRITTSNDKPWRKMASPQMTATPEKAMTPSEIMQRRIELELTVDEMAFALNITEVELMAIEAGESNQHLTREFREALDVLEERAFGTYVGA
jgi:DNA-binding XRE family transcriptional regulator